MRGMAKMVAPSGRQAAGLTTGVLLGAAIVLYQMTSLVLAPASNHQIPLSLRTGGHGQALVAATSTELAHPAELPVSYLRENVVTAARPTASSRRGSADAIRYAMLDAPVVTPVESPIALPTDAEKRSHHRGGGTSGRGNSD